MPLTLIAIRHGLTDNNTAGILQGQRLNSPLAAEGIAHAREIGTQLQQQTDMKALYASPLLRTLQTAQFIANALNLPIIQKPELKERDFGDLSGQRWQDIPENQNGQLKLQDKMFQYDYCPFGGENVDQVRTRLHQFLGQLRQHHPDQTVAAVTHGGILRLLHNELNLPQPPEIPPGSMHYLQI